MIYTTLNAAGQQHATKELAKHGIALTNDKLLASETNWFDQATFAEIENKCTDVEDGENPTGYEVSSNVYISFRPDHFNTAEADAE